MIHYDVDGDGYAKRVTTIDGNGKIIHVDSSVNTSSHASDNMTLGFTNGMGKKVKGKEELKTNPFPANLVPAG